MTRQVILEVLVGILTVVFLIMMVTTARPRMASAREVKLRGSTLGECIWVLVPWLILAVSVFPAVRKIVSSTIP